MFGSGRFLDLFYRRECHSQISRSQGIWATTQANEKKLNKAFKVRVALNCMELPSVNNIVLLGFSKRVSSSDG